MQLKPLADFQQVKDRYCVFLAGSIEMGGAEDWQETIATAFQEDNTICLLNPRRDSWDNSWEQSIKNPVFSQQVNWELDGLDRADLIVFYFAPGTKSPVSMLELGLYARTGKVIVCCPDGFWRKGNIDIICERYSIPQVPTINELILIINKRRI